MLLARQRRHLLPSVEQQWAAHQKFLDILIHIQLSEFLQNFEQSQTRAYLTKHTTYLHLWGVALCWLEGDLLRSFFSGPGFGNTNSVQWSNIIRLLVPWRQVIAILVSHWAQPSRSPPRTACGQEKLQCLKQELERSQPQTQLSRTGKPDIFTNFWAKSVVDYLAYTLVNLLVVTGPD